MTNGSRLLLRRLLLLLGGLAALRGGIYLLTPSQGEFVRYATAAPTLRIDSMTNGWSAAGALEVAELARKHFAHQRQLAEHFWPEPSLLEERPDCWVVVFLAKRPVYSLLGFERTLSVASPRLHLTIDKADYRTRFGVWCR